jgi:probable F420-dependent oxidoreductase
MKIGIVFPQYEFNGDPAAIKDFAQAAEALGYHHVLTYDHVLGANPDRPGGWHGPYTYEHAFYEPFGLFTFMAGVTKELGFITGILIAPQRPTALIAAQAATLDVLCHGRFRLGLGSGWNEVEYQALGYDFHQRGKRLDEQVDLLQALFTQPLVTFEGRTEKVIDAGLNPMPVQRPIPIWFGGHHDNVLRRVGEKGSGWLPGFRVAADAEPSLATIRKYAQAAGRDPAGIGLEPRVNYGEGDRAIWETSVKEWRAAGASHLSFNPLNAGLKTPGEHLRAMEQFANTIDLV